MGKSIDVDEENYVVFEPNHATNVGMKAIIEKLKTPFI